MRLQEACYLASGSASAVLTLHSTAQADVWQARRQESPRAASWVSHAVPQGLLDHDFARYKRGAAALHASSRSGRRVSLRLHVRCTPAAGTPRGLRDIASSSRALPADDTSTLHELLDGLLPEGWETSARICIQGVDAPLDAPLPLLQSYMCGPDGFVHVCALLNDTAQRPNV